MSRIDWNVKNWLEFIRRLRELGPRQNAGSRNLAIAFFDMSVGVTEWVAREGAIRGRPYMMSAKFWDFLTPSPLVRIWDWSTVLNSRNLPYYIFFWANPPSPLSADVIYGCPLTALTAFNTWPLSRLGATPQFLRPCLSCQPWQIATGWSVMTFLAVVLQKYLCYVRWHDTGCPAYSDSAGTAKKCHCKRVSLYPMMFSIRRSFFGPKNCHCIRSVTLTGVTVSGQACIITPVSL